MKIVFTAHAKERMKERGISEGGVIDIIKSPRKVEKRQGKYYAQKDFGTGRVEVIYEKENYIKVVTVYWI